MQYKKYKSYNILVIFLLLFSKNICIAKKERVKVNLPGDGPIFISKKELEVLNVQYDIEQEVAKCWNPPAGSSAKLSCTIRVFVSKSGRIKKAEVIKASGVLIYDVSAKAAVEKLNLPKSVRGKEINITFNQ